MHYFGVCSGRLLQVVAPLVLFGINFQRGEKVLSNMFLMNDLGAWLFGIATYIIMVVWGYYSVLVKASEGCDGNCREDGNIESLGGFICVMLFHFLSILAAVVVANGVRCGVTQVVFLFIFGFLFVHKIVKRICIALRDNRKCSFRKKIAGFIVGGEVEIAD